MKWIVRASAHVLYVKASISTFMRRFSRVGGTILSFVVTFSHADAILNRVTEGSGLLGTISSGTWGYSFTVGDQGLSVSSLGLYDYKGDQHGGLSAAHPVGIWDPVGSLLVSVTVPAGTSGTLEASFRYVSLSSPVTLNANQTYILGVGYDTGQEVIVAYDPLEASPNPPTYSSAVIPGNTRRNTSSGFSFPSADSVPGPGAVIGPNAIFVISEPSIWSLTIFGLFVVGLMRRGHKPAASIICLRTFARAISSQEK